MIFYTLLFYIYFSLYKYDYIYILTDYLNTLCKHSKSQHNIRHKFKYMIILAFILYIILWDEYIFIILCIFKIIVKYNDQILILKLEDPIHEDVSNLLLLFCGGYLPNIVFILRIIINFSRLNSYRYVSQQLYIIIYIIVKCILLFVLMRCVIFFEPINFILIFMVVVSN